MPCIPKIDGKVTYTFPNQAPVDIPFTGATPAVRTELVQTFSSATMIMWKMWELKPWLRETQYYWRGSFASSQQPVRTFAGFSGSGCDGRLVPAWLLDSRSAAYCEYWYVSYICPNTVTSSRCDLLIDFQRIAGITNQGCPTWTITRAKCPDGYLECDNGCMDCGALASQIRAL